MLFGGSDPKPAEKRPHSPDGDEEPETKKLRKEDGTAGFASLTLKDQEEAEDDVMTNPEDYPVPCFRFDPKVEGKVPLSSVQDVQNIIEAAKERNSERIRAVKILPQKNLHRVSQSWW